MNWKPMMLLTIHNLPSSTRYADIKTLLQSKCGIQHVILDNLMADGAGKVVTVGVAEDADAAILVRKINGLYWNNHQLYVEDVRQKKSASEQPFRPAVPSLQVPQTPYHSMNLQQHSSYSQGLGLVPNIMPPSVPPLMATMYYVPDYSNKPEVVGGNMIQTDQEYGQNSQKFQVPSAYMGISGYTHNPNQVSQFEMAPDGGNSQQSLQPPENPSIWANDNLDFTNNKPIYGQRSHPESLEGNWLPDQQMQQVNQLLDRSRDRPEPRLLNYAPTQPNFRSNIRPTETDFRSTIRPNEGSGFRQPKPDFMSNVGTGLLEQPSRREFGLNDQGRNEFPGRSNEFSRRPNDSQGRNEFPGRPNEFSRRPNDSQGRNEFPGRPNEFSRRPNDSQGLNEFPGRPNEFSRRPNDSQGLNEFPGRPNEFSSRPNDSQGRNEFPGRPNEFSRRSNDSQGRNEFSRRPNESQERNEFSGITQEFSKRPIDTQGRLNEFSGRSNEFSRRPNDSQGKQNEFSERRGRPNERQIRSNDRNEFSSSNFQSDFNRSNDRRDFGRSNERFHRPNEQRSRRNFDERGRSDRNFESRKRKFAVERDHDTTSWRNREAFDSKKAKQDEPLYSKKEMLRVSNKIRFNSVAVIRHNILGNLGIRDLDLITRQTFKKFLFERLYNIIGDKTMNSQECLDAYRANYPKSEDKATYNLVLELTAQKKADAANGVKSDVKLTLKPTLDSLSSLAVSKPSTPKPSTPKPSTPKPSTPKLASFKPSSEQYAPPYRKLSKSKITLKKRKMEAKQVMSAGKIPKYPEGDKSKVTQHKSEEKIGFVPVVTPLYKAAIDEEVKALVEIFAREFDNVPDENTKETYTEEIQTKMASEVKKVFIQTLARRISNTGLKVIRIHGAPKLPKRTLLYKVLQEYGITALNKSEKTRMYTITVDTYDNYDKLINIQSILVEDGNTISFKPFHAVAKDSVNMQQIKSMRNQMIKGMIDKSDLNLLNHDWPAKKAEIDAVQVALEAKLVAEMTALEANLVAKTASLQPKDTADGTEEKKELKTENGTQEFMTIDDSRDKDNLTEQNTANNDIDRKNDNLDNDFKVKDEEKKMASDVESTNVRNVVVNIDDGNNDIKYDVEANNDIKYDVDGNNDVKYDVGGNNEEGNVENNADEIKKELNETVKSNIDDVAIDFDVDIGDVDEDDLEDY